MAKTLRGREVALKVGQITSIEGVWFRVHKISKRDVVFRRLNPDKVAHVERVKAAQEARQLLDAESERIAKLEGGDDADGPGKAGPTPCLDPDKMHGAGDGFGGSDFDG